MSDPYDPEGNAGMDGVQEQFRTADGPEPVAWRMVPMMHDGKAGLTPVMFDAFWRAFTEAREHRGNFESVNAGYNAMLRYAPLPPVPADGPADAVSEAEVDAALCAWRAAPGLGVNRAIMRICLEAAQRARK